jgi:NADH-quinone oxidoreductase subunit J
MDNPGLFLYWILFFTTVAFALGVLLNRNTVKSAMCLVGMMGALAVNYLLMRQEFVAFIQILVYAGAIMVLFLFVIMLLNLKEPETTPWYLRSARFWGGALALVFFFVMAWGVQYFAVTTSPGMIAREAALEAAGVPEVYLLATTMITTYIVPFILTSVLLLVAVIGAIVMARRQDEDGNEITLEEEIV